MRTLRSFFGSLLISSPVLIGCAEVSADPAEANAGSVSQVGPCVENSTRCEGDLVTTCMRGSFGAPVACGDESVCRDGECRAPSPEQLAQASQLAAMLTYVKDETAWHSPIDWEKLRGDGRKAVLRGDGSDLAFFTALYHAFSAVPQGHQSLRIEACAKLVPFAIESQRGACGRPHSRGVVVTNTKPGNVLGLQKGDLVTQVGSARGADVLAALSERPMCTFSRPSVSSRDAIAATTFSDLLLPGEQIEIESPNGTKRKVSVPNAPLTGEVGLSCVDPFGRDTRVAVESELRPDGVGVIRLPSFMDPEQTLSENPTEAEVEEYIARFEAKILAAFDKVKSAPAIVWDLRGNGGGITPIAMNIASGFLGARGEPISYCEARISKSDPPRFDSFPYAERTLTPGGPFTYAGQVAVLIDGLDYSAADYFALAVKTRTDALLVGAPTSGAYGGSGPSKMFDAVPPFLVGLDPNRCSSHDDGLPLEGKSVIPDVAVEYDPRDLAAGKDSVLERAVQQLLQ
jgi:hypothetical protein